MNSNGSLPPYGYQKMSYMQPGRFAQPNNMVARPRSMPVRAPPVPSAGQATGPIMVPNRALHEIVGRIHPQLRVDPSVEEVILEMMSEFTDTVLNRSCEMAKHRSNGRIETCDVEFALKTEFGMENVPKLGIVPSRKRKFSEMARALAIKHKKTRSIKL